MSDPVFDALRVDVERTRARLPRGLECLADVVWNMAWSWLPDGCELFRDIDPSLWESSGHNARILLERASARRIAELLADNTFMQRVRSLSARMQEYLAASPAAQGAKVRDRFPGPVAYFCAEFGIHESLPIYSGGLGILAGDHLKSASDLGIPLVGVGLRYQQGYFHQGLDKAGWQVEYYHDTDFGSLPTGLVLKEDGTPLTVSVPLAQRTVTLQIWAVRVGRVPLLLLDSNRDDNDPVDRWITAHLYGGNLDTRLAQEIVLGIGGVRALRALGYQPSVFHMNEGHAAFLGLELIREGVQRGQLWEEALSAARSQTVFTTHTPVKAGHDSFHTDHVNSFLASYFDEFKTGEFEVPREKLLGLGRKYPEDPYEDICMTHIAMHGSRNINGVSKLHGEVSREMFHWLWPGKAREETPITHVTNGVHGQTWIAPLIQELLDRYVGPDWRERQADAAMWQAIDTIPDEELWETHSRLKQRLVQYSRARVRSFRENAFESPDYIQAADTALDPEALTFGFARRVATYKRLSLLLHDPERALGLLNMAGRPVQFVIAGKAHPGDSEAKRLLQYLFSVRLDPRVVSQAVFLVDYEVSVARQMVQGVDVWLNLPRRPLEASGTSGMKAGMNGVLNCSILDGWWAEGYNGKNGWAVGVPEDYVDVTEQDREDAESLYSTIEEKIIPLYFDRDSGGIPHGWVAMMKESMKSVAAGFNTHRMLTDYVDRIYVP